MPKDNPAFLYSQQYRPIGPASGQCLPEDTYIIGRVVLFWRPDEHQIRFAISAKYPSDVSTSAYKSTGSTATEKWTFMITLLPSASSLKSGQSAQEVIRAEYDAFLPYLGSEVKVAAEGLKVMLVNGKELHLEGSGARTMWTAKRGAWTVFQGRSPKLKGRVVLFSAHIQQIHPNLLLHLLGWRQTPYRHRQPIYLLVQHLKQDPPISGPSPHISHNSSTCDPPIAQQNVKEVYLPKSDLNRHRSRYLLSQRKSSRLETASHWASRD